MLEFLILIQSIPVSLWTERLDSEHWPHVRLRNADTDEAHDGRGESTGYGGGGGTFFYKKEVFTPA